MLEVSILVSWMLSGVGIAATLPDEEGSRWAWAPIAAIFGPLWFAVANERRSSAQTAQVIAATVDPAPAQRNADPSPELVSVS